MEVWTGWLGEGTGSVGKTRRDKKEHSNKENRRR